MSNLVELPKDRFLVSWLISYELHHKSVKTVSKVSNQNQNKPAGIEEGWTVEITDLRKNRDCTNYPLNISKCAI